jgi:hypothetical protein
MVPLGGIPRKAGPSESGSTVEHDTYQDVWVSQHRGQRGAHR